MHLFHLNFLCRKDIIQGFKKGFLFIPQACFGKISFLHGLLASGVKQAKFQFTADFKGNIVIVGRKSNNSLYSFDLATYGAEDEFDHKAAEGFIYVWGLPTRVWSEKMRG